MTASPERWATVERLYHAALARPVDARAAFVADACEGDQDLRREVESLLAQGASADAVLTRGAVVAAAGLVSDVSASALTGRRLGAYHVLSPLGAGGMGEVYRARDTRLGREVAIKILPREFTAHPDRLARFEREARVLASLNHPHIGGIYGVEEGEGIHALVLELVEGETLADRIARGAVPVKDALAMAREIADALDSAHEKGIVHRDLKPANIKITPKGMVKVLDFGLAKVDAEDAAPNLSKSPTMTIGATHGGVILGTAPYMSPEQARGQVVDKRTDIWAFGCVLYEMLAGRAAFQGDTLSDLIAAVLHREPDWALLPATTPASIHRLLRRCLAKETRRRLHDIADAALEIDDALAGTLDASPAATAHETASVRLRWIGASISVVALSAAGIAGWYLARPSADRDAATPQFSRIVRVTSGPAREVAPVISPDGKWVAYVSNERGPNDIWVKFVSGGAPANLTASASLDIGANTAIGGLDISPDGTRIAVQARPIGAQTPFATWEVPAPLPGLPHKLLDDGLLGMRWSPDGRQITYIRAGASAGDALWSADADGTNRRELIKAQGGLHIHWPTWSADGFIYFMRTVSTIGNLDQAEIYRINARGGATEAVVSTLRRAMHPVPTDRGLVYAANPTSGEMSLWWRPAGGEPRRVTTGVGEYAEPRLSSDGQRLVATAYDIHETLVRVAVAPTAAPAPSRLTDGFGGDLDPTISTTGSQLVFSSWRAGERKLWTSTQNASNPQPLTSGPGFDDRPAFSPDGRQIAFASDRGGSRAIWLVSSDGGTPRKLVDASLPGSVSWSSDGKEIVYSATAGDWPGLSSVSVADSTVRRITTPGVATDPAWSPTRDLIAYLQPNTTGPTIVRLAFVNSKGEAQYGNVPPPVEPATGFNNGMIAWSPDGQRLAVVSQNTNAPASIWIVTLQGATLSYRKLVELPNGPRIRGLTWTPDGSSIVFGQHDAGSDIVLLDQAVSP